MNFVNAVRIVRQPVGPYRAPYAIQKIVRNMVSENKRQMELDITGPPGEYELEVTVLCSATNNLTKFFFAMALNAAGDPKTFVQPITIHPGSNSAHVVVKNFGLFREREDVIALQWQQEMEMRNLNNVGPNAAEGAVGGLDEPEQHAPKAVKIVFCVHSMIQENKVLHGMAISEEIVIT